MKKVLALLLLFVCISYADNSLAEQLFVFDSQMVIENAMIPGTANVYGVLASDSTIPTPVPLDFENYEYTVYVNLIIENEGNPVYFTHGEGIVIYEDDVTSSDWAEPSTFRDGTAVLVGFVGPLVHTMSSSTEGNVQGPIQWLAGSHIDEIGQENHSGWTFTSTVSLLQDHVLPGYSERWAGHISPPQGVVGSMKSCWSDIKSVYR